MTTAAVCLIVKNEAQYMVEWIAHYLALGFDEILVYDNDSTDMSAAMLESFATREPRIRLEAWPDVAGEVPQITAYNDAISRVKSEWLAFFDADELLVLKQHANIGDFLARYPMQAGTVAINWLLFGSSGQKAYVDDLQSRRFRWCARDEPKTKNRFVKSITKVRAVTRASSHSAQLKPGFLHYTDRVEPTEILQECKTPTASHEVAQVNHYVVRSAEEFVAKRARGNVARASNHPEKFGRDEYFWQTHDTNHREDWAIDPWIERARDIRIRLRQHLVQDQLLPRKMEA